MYVNINATKYQNLRVIFILY